MASPANTPGWYPDPDGRPGERWWNGVGWSDARRGAPGASVPPPAPPSATPPAAPASATAAPSAAPAYGAPVIYSAANPAPQFPGHQVPPGAPGYTPRAAVTVDTRQNPFALYALIAGIAAFFFNILLVPSVLAIVFARKAFARAAELHAAGQEDRTKGLATAGLVMGIVGGVFGLFQGLFMIIGFLPIFFFDYTP